MNNSSDKTSLGSHGARELEHELNNATQMRVLLMATLKNRLIRLGEGKCLQLLSQLEDAYAVELQLIDERQEF